MQAPAKTPGESAHPFKWYVPENAHTLLIGTFPPVERRWAFDFFYPNPRNIFWKILGEIGSKNLPASGEAAIVARKNLLDELKLGITDMGGIIRRLSDNSLDENLELVEHMPIFDILKQNPTINTIILTSSSGKVSALAWFKLYLVKHGITIIIPKTPKPIHFQIPIIKSSWMYMSCILHHRERPTEYLWRN